MTRARRVRLRGRRRAASARGFTLMEALMACVVLVIAVAALCSAVSAGHLQTAAALHGARASLLADAMLEEVLVQPYSDPALPDTENTRATFDDLDDYHNYTETIAANIADAAGVAYPQAYQGFSRSVTVTATTAAAPGGTIAGKRVTVTVADAAGGRWIVAHFVPEPSDD